jgi:hypothetical protein
LIKHLKRYTTAFAKVRSQLFTIVKSEADEDPIGSKNVTVRINKKNLL